LLWIKGDAGKGKTMLICGIIDELKKPTINTGLVSFFFCQGTDLRINNATAVLRGLIYLLADGQPSLIPHIWKKYDHAGGELFKDMNAWTALSDIFSNILQDPSLPNTVLVVDALDECITDLPLLLDLIIETPLSSRVKWILSSRHRTDIERGLRLDGSRTRLSLELKENAEQVSHVVDAYIDHCISELVVIQDKIALQDQIRDILQQKFNGTFLWVALVVQELKKAEHWEMLDVINEVPSRLEELYCQMIGQIQLLGWRKPELCRGVLSIVTAAYRPLHLAELSALSSLPPDISSDITTIVNICGSFLTIRDNIVYTIHQSAQEFLSADTSIFPSGKEAVHHAIFSRSLQIMSRTLRRDVYSLKAPGFPIDEVKTPNPDPLAAVRYSSVYWVDHFCQVEDQSSKRETALSDNGAVFSFFKKHFLTWLESLSLLFKVPDAIASIRKLLHIIDVCLYICIIF
jgi:hypothetical protein